MDLWRGLGASDVDTLNHNNLNLFITVHCQLVNPLRKSKHKSASKEVCIIWELLLLFHCMLLPLNSFVLICYGLSIISYKYALILLWRDRASFQLEIAKLWNARFCFMSNNAAGLSDCSLLKEVLEILSGSAISTFKYHSQNFKAYAEFNWKPVKVFQTCYWAVKSAFAKSAL